MIVTQPPQPEPPEPLDAQLSVMLTRSEKNALKRQAADSGSSMSALGREAIKRQLGR